MIILGSFIFRDGDFETPERVPFGGEQMLSVHRLLGGTRVVDAMGPDDREIAWSGRFQSFDANVRARQIDAMRISGAQVPLIVDGEFRTVVVKSFIWNYERFYQIPYEISLLVVTSQLDTTADTLDLLVSNGIQSVTSLLSSFTAGAL